VSGIEAQLLGLLALYGYVVVFGTVFVSALGAPLPASLVLLAAGGFASSGDLNPVLVVAATAAGAFLGDCAIFGLARWAGVAAIQRYGGNVGLTGERIQAARDKMGRWTGASIFLTRWLITPLALPVDVVAGVSQYSFLAFALFSLLGETLWGIVYVGAGYLFGENWESVSGILSDSATLLLGVTLLIVALIVLFRAVAARRETQKGQA